MTIVLGNALKSARLRKGMRQWQLAEEIGVTRAAVGQWEAGTNEPSSQNLLKLSEILEINLADLTQERRTEAYKKERSDRGILITQAATDGFDIPVTHLVATENGNVIDMRGQIEPTYIRRFDFMIDNDSIFGMIFGSNILSPKYEQGDIVYIDPNQKPVAGEYGIFSISLRLGDGSPAYRVVRRASVIDPKRVILTQFKPDRQEEWPLNSLGEMQRILPAKELLLPRGK